MDPATQAKLMEILKSTGVGAGIGGATLGGLTAAFGEDDPNDPGAKNQKVLRNLMLGAALGGTAGAGYGGMQQIGGPKTPFKAGDGFTYDNIRGVLGSNVGNATAATGLSQLYSTWKQRAVNKFLTATKGKDRPLGILDPAGKPMGNVASQRDTAADLKRVGGSYKNPAVLEGLRSGLQIPSSQLRGMKPSEMMQFHANKANVLGADANQVPFSERLQSMNPLRALKLPQQMSKFNPLRMLKPISGPATDGMNGQYGFGQARNVNALTGMTKLPFLARNPGFLRNPAVFAGTYGLSKGLNTHFDNAEQGVVDQLNQQHPGAYR